MKNGVVFTPAAAGGGGGWSAVDADEVTPGLVTLSEAGDPIVIPAARIPELIEAAIAAKGFIPFDQTNTDRLSIPLSTGVLELGLASDGSLIHNGLLNP